MSRCHKMCVCGHLEGCVRPTTETDFVASVSSFITEVKTYQVQDILAKQVLPPDGVWVVCRRRAEAHCGCSKEEIMQQPSEGESFVVLPAPGGLEAYTRRVDDLCRTLERASKSCSRFCLHIQGGDSEVPQLQCSSEALNGWEVALSKLQKRNLLLIAILDGQLCDLSLSLAMACDVRLATDKACLLPRHGSGPHLPLPSWWLASLALHAGVLRAQQLLWRRRGASGADLLACGLVHTLGVSSTELMATAAALPLPAESPRALLRRIVLQCFSISGADQIGHSLAVSSLGIADAVGRAAGLAGPLPELTPLRFRLSKSAEAWTLEMSARLECTSLDELDGCMRQLNRALANSVAGGGPLPRCLVIKLFADAAHAVTGSGGGSGDSGDKCQYDRCCGQDAPPPALPVELMRMHEGTEWNMKMLKWLTKLEKMLTTLATLPLPTVAFLAAAESDGASASRAFRGTIGMLALQIAFTCDVRVAMPGVHLDFGVRSGVLPGTLAFRLAKHVGAGVAVSMLGLDANVSAEEALRTGAVQQLAEAFDPSTLAHAPYGAALLLCRYLLHDAVWTMAPSELQERLLIWQRPTSAEGATGTGRGGIEEEGMAAGEGGHGGGGIGGGGGGGGRGGGGGGGGAAANCGAAATVSSATVSAEQIEQLAAFFPDQFILPTEAWQWKLSWSAVLPPEKAEGPSGGQEGQAETLKGSSTVPRTPPQPRLYHPHLTPRQLL